jgi:hypothetical protein
MGRMNKPFVKNDFSLSSFFSFIILKNKTGTLSFFINYQDPIFMKTLYKHIRAVRNVSSDEFPQALSILLLIFFLVFGTACMFMLL